MYVAVLSCKLGLQSTDILRVPLQRLPVRTARDEYVHLSLGIYSALTRFRPAEVVLSLLLSHFTFEFSKDKPVYWNHSGVIYPSLEKDSDQPQMWLRVSKYTAEAAS